jgi:DNA-binding NarL/FixJ family response regulator
MARAQHLELATDEHTSFFAKTALARSGPPWRPPTPFADGPDSGQVGDDPLWRAARRALADGSRAHGVGEAWQQFSQGRLRQRRHCKVGDRIYLAARVARASDPGQAAPSAAEASTLVRVLCGEQQKMVASTLSIATSTASRRFVEALRKLGISRDPIPLPLVIAAQTWSGIDGTSDAQCARFDDATNAYVVLSVPLPDMTKALDLTSSEREVATLFVEGLSRSEIARRRRTSKHTTARQVHAIFATLGVRGRCDLIRRLYALGFFGRAAGASKESSSC